MSGLFGGGGGKKQAAATGAAAAPTAAFLNVEKGIDEVRTHEQLARALAHHYRRQGHDLPAVLVQDIERMMDFAAKRAAARSGAAAKS